MLYITCTMITSVDLAHYGVSRAKDWVSVDCGTNKTIKKIEYLARLYFKRTYYLRVVVAGPRSAIGRAPGS